MTDTAINLTTIKRLRELRAAALADAQAFVSLRVMAVNGGISLFEIDVFGCHCAG